MINKFTEWEGEIAGVKVRTHHGVVYINGKELDFLNKFENAITDVILELLKNQGGEIDGYTKRN